MPAGGSTAAEERLARIRAGLDARARATSETGVTAAETVTAAAEILIEAFLGELAETASFPGAPAT